MKLLGVKKNVMNGKAVISAEITSSHFKKSKTIFFSYPEEYYDYLPDNADPFFPAILIPAMMTDRVLEVVPSFSQKMFENQATIQDIFAAWHPSDFKKVKVAAGNLHNDTGKRSEKNATFFSLGVDSMYSMLKYLPQNNPPAGKQLTSLVYMKGLELPLSVYAKGQDQDVINASRKVGAHYNLDVIVGETNIRDVFPLDWEDHYFGPGLAATALSLSNGLRNIYIPSSHSYAIFFHDPSSPLIDNLWSNERTNIFHDGSEKERAEKIADLIVHDSFALNHLRVCVSNEGGGYNCGKCWKCIRTMVTLEILGVLKDSNTFPHKLPKHYYTQLRTYIPDSLEFTRENLKLAQLYGRKDLERKLQREINIGTLDIYRNGKPVHDFFKEVLMYCFVKVGRKTGLYN